MKENLLEWLRCPACREGSLDCDALERDEREILAGSLCCRKCGRKYTLQDGIVDLRFGLSETAWRELDEYRRDTAVLVDGILDSGHGILQRSQASVATVGKRQ